MGMSRTRHAAADIQTCRINTGQYTGDGTLSQAITGIGFPPKFVWIFLHVLVQSLTVTKGSSVRIDQMTTNIAVSELMRNYYDNNIISLDADGFTVDDDGVDIHPNKADAVYDYVAMG